MSRTSIAVEDILTDPDHPVDLSTPSSSDAADRIPQFHSFLPSIESISVQGDIALTDDLAANLALLCRLKTI